jgi:hypothetical protein
MVIVVPWVVMQFVIVGGYQCLSDIFTNVKTSCMKLRLQVLTAVSF